jgi:hypothetical protein
MKIVGSGGRQRQKSAAEISGRNQWQKSAAVGSVQKLFFNQ